MTYEKFIKKNGKTYGPYLYESKRVDGKVISEYHGYSEKKSYKKFFLIFFSILIVCAFIAGFFILKPSLQGKVVLSLQGYYEKNIGFNGAILLNLKQGELIPADSVLSVENNGNINTYVLSDLLQQPTESGNYYLENKNLNGSGLGYGVAGEKINYPEVYFKFNIIAENQTNSNNETTQPNETIITEVSNSDLVPSVNESIDSSNENSNFSSETTEPVQQQAEVPAAENSESTSSVGVVANFFGFFQRIFLSLNPTGKPTFNIIDEIQGSVSYNNPFKYNLKEGESVEIIPDSVRTESNTLSPGVLNVKIENSELIITTDYFETSNGFGENYISSTQEILPINISSLNSVLDKGDLKITLTYNNQELASYSVKISENLNIREPINETLNKTINIKQKINITLNETTLYVNNLTDEEKQILIDNFGNATVISSSKVFKDRVIVTFSIGTYSSEYSHDFNLPDNTIKSLIDVDRINWLKDLAKSLSFENTQYQNLNKFNEQFSFSENSFKT